MTRRRWIADEVVGDRAALTGEHAVHLSRVLRVQTGQEFDVACGDVVRKGIVATVCDERVEFELREAITASEAVPITLLLAVFKFDRMEWAIEKCTELNVTTIVPVIARRTEKHLALAAEKQGGALASDCTGSRATIAALGCAGDSRAGEVVRGSTEWRRNSHRAG